MSWALNERFGSVGKGRATSRQAWMCSMSKGKGVWGGKELLPDGVEIVCYMVIGNKAAF